MAFMVLMIARSGFSDGWTDEMEVAMEKEIEMDKESKEEMEKETIDLGGRGVHLLIN